MKLKVFLELERQDIAKIIKDKGKPLCVAIMLDGTRRILKLSPGHHDDSWLYYKDHIRNLMYKSIEIADMLFDMGVEVVVGPLASFGNLHRKDFMPKGLKRLLDPLCDEYPTSVFKKHKAAVSFYGDLEYTKLMPGGKIINYYENQFKEINPIKPNRRILVGLGFSTDRETKVIAHRAIQYYKRNKKEPSLKQLVIDYFGFDAPSIDIFIRSNEVRLSGGLTPLLAGHDTQLYFPVSPGILSFSEKVIKHILYDYLFSRVLSHGMHEHHSITEKQAKIAKKFYFDSKDNVLGVGKRIADMWIHQAEEVK